jgi:hypothetical protein
MARLKEEFGWTLMDAVVSDLKEPFLNSSGSAEENHDTPVRIVNLQVQI